MNGFTILIIALVVLLFISIIIAIMAYNASFRNVAWIARQTGKERSDVIWLSDKFRVINKDGFWEIQFRHLTERTSSVNGRFWTKFIAPKYVKKVVKFKENEWKGSDLSKKLQRGLFLYETTEGEFFPMEISFDGSSATFKPFGQDNRQFLINEIKDINDLTKNKKREMLILLAIIIGIIVLGVVVVMSIIYLKNSSVDQMAQLSSVCSSYANALFNATTTTAQQAGWATNAAHVVAGG